MNWSPRSKSYDVPLPTRMASGHRSEAASEGAGATCTSRTTARTCSRPRLTGRPWPPELRPEPEGPTTSTTETPPPPPPMPMAPLPPVATVPPAPPLVAPPVAGGGMSVASVRVSVPFRCSDGAQIHHWDGSSWNAVSAAYATFKKTKDGRHAL